MIAVGIISASGTVLAKTPQFRLDMDNLNLNVGTSINLVLSLTDAKGAEVTSIDGLEDFDVITSGSSSVTQMVNGVTTYEEVITYVVMPKKEGQFTLRGNVTLSGKSYQTNALEVNVSAANDTENGEADDLFVKTTLSENEIYFGQKIVLAYDVYSRYNLENFGFLDTVSLTDFIGKDIPQEQLKSEITYIDGKQYAHYQAKETFLSPIKTGDYNIPAYDFQVNVSSGDFFNPSKPFYFRTDPVTLKVKPLPEDNKPQDFSGIVGKLNLEGAYNNQEVNYGDSLILNVTASGNCNLDGLKEIIQGDLPGFTVYQTEKNSEEGVGENGQYHAAKEFEIILVPKDGGNLTIDPISIPYFNPETGAYERSEIQGTTITVKGENPLAQAVGGNATANYTPSVETVKIEQVNYNLQDQRYLTVQLDKNILFIGLAVLLILLILTAVYFWFRAYRKRLDGNLLTLYRKIKASNSRDEVYRLFNDMMKYKYNISLKSSTRNNVAARLADVDFADSVLEIMNYMENEKFRSDKGEGYLKTKIGDIYKHLNRC